MSCVYLNVPTVVKAETWGCLNDRRKERERERDQTCRFLLERHTSLYRKQASHF